MRQKTNFQPPDVIILIAAQFNEKEVVSCHSALRDKQLSVVLVSVNPGLVRSIRGITVHPDTYLSQGMALVAEKRQIIILAGGEACAAQALSDPRTHQLVQHMLQQNGYVAVMAHAERLVAETGLLTPEWADYSICQGRMETAVFAEQLIAYISA